MGGDGWGPRGWMVMGGNGLGVTVEIHDANLFILNDGFNSSASAMCWRSVQSIPGMKKVHGALDSRHKLGI